MGGAGFDPDATRINPMSGVADEGVEDHALRMMMRALKRQEAAPASRARLYPYAIAGGVVAAGLRAPALVVPFLAPLLSEATTTVEIRRRRSRLREITDAAAARGDVDTAALAALLHSTSYLGHTLGPIGRRAECAHVRAVAWCLVAGRDEIAGLSGLLAGNPRSDAGVTALVELAEGEWLLSPQERVNLLGAIVGMLDGRAWEAPGVRLTAASALEELERLAELDLERDGGSAVGWFDPLVSPGVEEQCCRQGALSLEWGEQGSGAEGVAALHIAQAVADVHATRGPAGVTELLAGWTDGERLDIHRLAQACAAGMRAQGDLDRAAAWQQVAEMPAVDAVRVATRWVGTPGRGAGRGI